MSPEEKYPQQKITLPDFAKVLALVYPPATYSRVFHWVKTGHLNTYRDPIMKKGHHYVDTSVLQGFLALLGLTKKDIELVSRKLKLVLEKLD